MFSFLFHTLVYDPLYNGLIFLVSGVPFANVGLAVILLTVIVKFILFPLSMKAVRTQMAIRLIEPDLARIKEKYKNNRAEQARKTMELYRENHINAFSSIFLILIQFPIIIGLYWVFANGGLPAVNHDLLYAFVREPAEFNMHFLWISDVAGKSMVLAVLAGVAQFFQIRLTLPPIKARSGGAPSLKEDLARSFQLQMRYMMPILIVVFAYITSAAIALYWATSALFAISQELYVRKHVRKEPSVKPATGVEDNTAVSSAP